MKGQALKLTLVAAAFLLLAGCAELMQGPGARTNTPDPPERDAAEVEEARVEVRRVLDQLMQAHNNADLEMAMEVYADDAVLFPPNERPVRGKRRIRARYKKLYAETLARLHAVSRETEGEEMWAFDRGTVQGAIYNRQEFEESAEAKPLRQVNDKYVMILRRDLEGRWRIVRLIWNSSEPDRP